MALPGSASGTQRDAERRREAQAGRGVPVHHVAPRSSRSRPASSQTRLDRHPPLRRLLEEGRPVPPDAIQLLDIRARRGAARHDVDEGLAVLARGFGGAWLTRA